MMHHQFDSLLEQTLKELGVGGKGGLVVMVMISLVWRNDGVIRFICLEWRRTLSKVRCHLMTSTCSSNSYSSNFTHSS